MIYKMDCNLCAELRPLASHMHELALACAYLGNTVVYADGEDSRAVRSETIADWLRLASQLEVVTINTWKFEDDGLWCGTAADMVTSESTHFTQYSTALTRFMFVTNALEETYRFVDRHYAQVADAMKIPEKKKSRSCSIRAAVLIDSIPKESWPKHLEHLTTNYKGIFARYKNEHKAELCGMQFADETRPAYALHLVRNLRNHVAHGIFPIIPNPDYMWEKGGDAENLLQLLNHSCRLGAIYIQMLIKRFNEGFIGYDYLACMNAHGPEFEYFVGHCNTDYIGKLHVRGDFSLTQAFDYSSKPWE